MTGLDPNSERIIEIFTAVTDENLTEIIEGPDLVIKQPNEILDQMDEWNQEHHKKSGLIDEVKRSVITQEGSTRKTECPMQLVSTTEPVCSTVCLLYTSPSPRD